jgi:hypothetical protein
LGYVINGNLIKTQKNKGEMNANKNRKMRKDNKNSNIRNLPTAAATLRTEI